MLKQAKILGFLPAISSSSDHTQIENEFYDFRERQNNFSPVKGAWENSNDAVLFWRKIVGLFPLHINV